MTSLKRFLTVAENATVAKTQHPVFRDYQITPEITGESEDTRSLAKGIGEISREYNIPLKSLRVYGKVEPKEWKRVRNKHLRGSEKAAANREPEREDRFKLDWPAGSACLLSAPGDSTGELLGRWRRAREQWTWAAGLA